MEHKLAWCADAGIRVRLMVSTGEVTEWHQIFSVDSGTVLLGSVEEEASVWYALQHVAAFVAEVDPRVARESVSRY